jgi:hypothetical protein
LIIYCIPAVFYDLLAALALNSVISIISFYGRRGKEYGVDHMGLKPKGGD